MLLKNNSQIQNMTIESLQKIIDQQNQELSKLRWAATHITEYENKKKILDEQIADYRKLSSELRSLIKEQKQLNKELSQNLINCKKEINKMYQNKGVTNL